jgi:CelD/BcsL family acetyltransferase involved in cellulose biosynthesis
VEIVTDREAFFDLEPGWNDLVAKAGVGHPFLRHEWLRTWWECFGDDRRLHIVTVSSGSEIVAIAPLMREDVRMYGVPVRRLRLLHNDHVPRADFIVAGGSDVAYRAIWMALENERESWDVLQLSPIPGHSRTLDAMSKLARADGCPVGAWHGGDSPYLELSGTWSDYVASLRGKFRQNIRNRLARLDRLGEPALEVVSGGLEIRDDCEDAIRLEASGWKRTAKTAISCDRATHRFYAELAERAAKRGWLRLLYLRVNGRRIAASYSLLYEGRLFLCKTGYDPEFSAVSPFKILTYLALRLAFAEGYAAVDFLGDPEPWKLQWTSTTLPHDWLFVFSATPRGRLLHSLKFQLIPALKQSPIAGFMPR